MRDNHLVPEHVLVLYENSRRGAAAIQEAVAVAPADARLTVVTVAVTESQGAKCCDTRAGYWNGVVRELAGADLDRARSLIGDRTTAVFKVLTGQSVLAALTLEAQAVSSGHGHRPFRPGDPSVVQSAPGAPAAASRSRRDRRLSERFRLELLELGLVDGAAVEQLLGALDLARRAAVCGDGADVLVEVGL